MFDQRMHDIDITKPPQPLEKCLERNGNEVYKNSRIQALK